MIKSNIQNISKKTIAYYLVMATIAVFIFSEFILRGPVLPVVAIVDGFKTKYILLGITAFLLFLLILRRKKGLFKDGVFKREAKWFLCGIGALAVITLYYQIKNGFKAFAIVEFTYLLIPLLFVILLTSVDYFNISRILDNCFYVAVIVYILGIIDILNLSSIFSISLSDSASSPFENGGSIIFVCFELYFLIRYGKRNGKSLICLLLTVLSFKRVSVIKAILFFIFVPMLKNKKVPRWLFVLVIVIFCALPFVLEFVYSESFATIMLAKFGMNFNQLTMDRYRRTSFVLNNLDQIKYGYGSVTYFLTNNYGIHETANRSLHSDILRIYLECSFIGTFAYNVCNFLAVKKNMISFILMLHIFTEMIINHPIGAGSVGNWIIYYLMIVYFNYRNEVPFYKEGMIKRKKIKLGKLEI